MLLQHFGNDSKCSSPEENCSSWTAIWLTGAGSWRYAHSLIEPHHANLAPSMADRLQAIRSQVYFADQMPASAVVAELEKVGFVDPVIDRNLWRIHWAQARKMSFWRGLERLVQQRFAICVTKPN